MALYEGVQDDVAVPFETHDVEAGDGPEMETKLAALFASLPGTVIISDLNLAGDGVGHRWVCTVTTMKTGQQSAPTDGNMLPANALAGAVVAGNAAELELRTTQRIADFVVSDDADGLFTAALAGSGVGPGYMQVVLMEG